MPKQFQASRVPYLKPSAFWPMPDTEAVDPELSNSPVSPAASGPTVLPTLTLTPPDHVVLPSNVVSRGLSVVFPYIRRQSGGSAVSIRYISKWQLTEGGAGSRSMKDPKGYIGYGGKEIKLSVSMHDAISGAPGGFSVHHIIQTLIYWAYMTPMDALIDRPINSHILKLKKEADTTTQTRIINDYWAATKGGAKTKLEEGSSSDDFSYESWIEPDVKKKSHGTARRELTGLAAPIPPLPLTFTFGSILIFPCVIKTMRITIKRYDSVAIRSADIDITLQEILGKSIWNAKVDDPEILLDVMLDPPDAKPPVPVTTESRSGGAGAAAFERTFPNYGRVR